MSALLGFSMHFAFIFDDFPYNTAFFQGRKFVCLNLNLLSKANI